MSAMKDLLVSVEEYLSTPFEPDCEYIDGIIVERNVGERDHSLWQSRLIIFLGQREKEWNILTFTEWRMQVRATRFRIPDVTVIHGGCPPDRVLRTPPLLAIEIWSPEDRPAELQKKIKDYRELQIPYTLVIYPDEPRFVLYTLDSETELTDGVLRIENPAMEVPLLDIYNGMPGR